MFKITKQRPFSNGYDLGSHSFVRVFNKNLRDLGGRHSWVKISNGSSSIFRMAKAAKSSQGFNAQAIELDYDSMLELNAVQKQNDENHLADDNGFYPCELEISKAGFFDVFKAYWKHPEQGYRISIRISMISFVIGMMGLIQNVIVMFK